MTNFSLYKISNQKQSLISIAVVVLTASVCYLFSDYFGYRNIALILLFVVSILATFMNVFPLLIAAILSALIWDYFFIPPKFTFHVESAEDILMLGMYFVVALVNAILTNRIRKAEKEANEKEEKEKIIKLYNTLLNSLSHELRTPIATINWGNRHLTGKRRKTGYSIQKNIGFRNFHRILATEPTGGKSAEYVAFGIRISAITQRLVRCK